MQTLKEVLRAADAQKNAVGHFNISNIEGLWAIFHAACHLKLPVIIGLSEGERDFVGVKQAVALVKSIREEFDYPIFSNADHTYSFGRVKEAVDAGFDAVIFDGAKLPIDENIAITKQCVEYARSKNPDIVVEGELGYIGTSSKLLDEIPEGVGISEKSLTSAEDAARYVRETGVDLFSPSVGNIHGILKNMPNPRLNISRVQAIRQAAGVPIVLHGGSGIADQDFIDAIKAGVAIIHINTEIRVAYRDAVKQFIEEHPEEIAPYKIMKSAIDAMQSVVDKRLRLFSGAG